MLPPFHGERMEEHRATVAALAAAEVARWVPGRPLRTLPRMQELTLDVILRVVLGAPDPPLRAAIRAALDMTTSLAAPDRALAGAARLGAVAAVPRRGGAGRRAPARRDPRARAARREPAVLDELIAAGATEDELRDQVVTLLAAGHETTAGSLAWALERLARHPAAAARLREGDDAYLEATVKEVLRTRPVLSITPRKVRRAVHVGAWTLPPGVHVTPCLYLAHRRPELWPDPTAFRPERFLEGAPRRSRGCRSAAACAAAPAPRSRRWSCTRCCAPSSAASTSGPTAPRASGCAAAASR